MANSAHSDTGCPSPNNSEGCKIEPPDSPDPLDLELNGQTKLDDHGSLHHQHQGHNPHHQPQQQSQAMYPSDLGSGGKPTSGLPVVSSSAGGSMGLGGLGVTSPSVGATAPHGHHHQSQNPQQAHHQGGGGIPSSLAGGMHTHHHQTNDVSALMPDYQAL